MALWHIDHLQNKKNRQQYDKNTSDLYRIFYYDAPPLGEQDERTQNPLTKEHIVFNKTPEYFFRSEFLKELKKKRKVALRMGKLSTTGWTFSKKETVKELCMNKKEIRDLQDSDIEFLIRQKGVDMRIGIDIATLAYKKLADTIVLISGDSDFVPASKLARREGIDFILDPMWSGKIHDDLFEHIDGLQSWPKLKPNKKSEK